MPGRYLKFDIEFSSTQLCSIGLNICQVLTGRQNEIFTSSRNDWLQRENKDALIWITKILKIDSRSTLSKFPLTECVTPYQNQFIGEPRANGVFHRFFLVPSELMEVGWWLEDNKWKHLPVLEPMCVNRVMVWRPWLTFTYGLNQNKQTTTQQLG